MPRSKSTYRRFTPEERARFEKAKAEDLANMEQLKAQGREMMARIERKSEILASLRRARIAAGMSLADVDAKTGMGRGNLSKLENDPHANPTLDTLLRLADAIGVELRVAVIGPDGKLVAEAA